MENVMAVTYEHASARFRSIYAKLLRYYPDPYRERFGESMEQTFNDLCKERQKAGDELFSFVLWVFVETSLAILKERIIFMITQNKNVVRIALMVGLILLIPLALTVLNPNAHLNGGKGGGWDWAPGDFLAMGVLLFGTGLAIDFTMRKLANPVHRVVAIVATVSVLFLIWVELAVDGVTQALEFLF